MHTRGHPPSYWFAFWFVHSGAIVSTVLASEGSDDPTINQEWDKSNTFFLNRQARSLFVRRRIALSRSHQNDSCAKANVEHLLMQPLQICLMRNWFSLLFFFFSGNEAGCPSGLATAGGSAPREQQSDREGELLTPRTGSKEQLTGRNDSQTGPFRRTWWWLLPASFTTTPGCRARTDGLLRC